MIRVTDTIVLDDREVSEYFVGATGPGAQNVQQGLRQIGPSRCVLATGS